MADAPTTMAQVARLAGVSTATVSHVINQTRKLAPATEARVRSAIAELAYIPDPSARSLRAGSSDVVGVAMPAISNPYLATFLHELEEALAAAGKSMLLADTHDDPEVEAKAVRDLIARRLGGLVLAPSGSPDYAIELGRRYAVPLVMIDLTEERDDCDQIVVESVQAVEKVTAHLIDKGHRRIGMVSGLPGIRTTDQRVEGYRRAHERAGLALDPVLIPSGRSSRAGGRAATDTLLGLSEPPTAVVTGNNAMTIGSLEAIKARGLTVPGDIAMVCFDDFDWAELFEPQLTAIAPQVALHAKRVVEMLTRRLAHPDAPAQHETLTPTIMHRNSCGCDAATAVPL
jgi:LacI family transcriptional regulator